MKLNLVKVNVVLVLLIIVSMASFASEVPPIDEIVQRYSRIVGKGLVEGFKPTIAGHDFVVTGPNWTVPQVVYDVMQRGGNFWDAAAAGMWMTEITGGQMTPGTAPFIMYVADEKKVYSYNGVGTAPALGTVDYFIDKFGDSIKHPAGFYYVPTGEKPDDQWYRQNVAASPDNIFALLIKFGSMSFTECFEEVLRAMELGWPLGTNEANFVRNGSIFKGDFATDPNFAANRAHWRQNGPNAMPGDPLIEHGLANTIRAMMDVEQEALASGKTREEALKAARDWYYRGPIARQVDRLNRENDGMMRYEDYAMYQGIWDDMDELPHTNYMGVDFYANPTYTQGGVLILVLNILDNFDLVSLGWNTPEYIHVITQAFELAFADRWQYFGDPNFTEIPKALWSKEYGTLRAGLIDMTKRFPDLPPPGDPWNMKAILEDWEPWVAPLYARSETDTISMLAADIFIQDESDHQDGDTIIFNMIDKDGNLFVYCPSDGRQSSTQLAEWGVGITRRGRQYTLDPDFPSCIEPGKRPVSTPHTWLAVKDGEGYLSVQSPGGDDQIQCALPIVLNYMIWGMPPQVAIDQPRFATDNYLSHFTPYYDEARIGSMEVDKEMPKETIEGLEALGHYVNIGPMWAIGQRPVMVVRDPKTSLVYAASSVFREFYHFGR